MAYDPRELEETKNWSEINFQARKWVVHIKKL